MNGPNWLNLRQIAASRYLTRKPGNLRGVKRGGIIRVRERRKSLKGIKRAPSQRGVTGKWRVTLFINAL